MRKTRLRLESLDERAVPSATTSEPPPDGGTGQTPVAESFVRYSPGEDENGNALYVTVTAQGDVWLSTVDSRGAGQDLLLSSNANTQRPPVPTPQPNFEPQYNRPGGIYRPPSNGRPGGWDIYPSDGPGTQTYPYSPSQPNPGWQGFYWNGMNWWIPPGATWPPQQTTPAVPPTRPQNGPNAPQNPTPPNQTPPPVTPQQTRPGADPRPNRPAQPPIGGNVFAGPNGTVIQTDPNGTRTTWYPNGRVKREEPGVNGQPGVVTYWGPPDNPVVTRINPNGTTSSWSVNGDLQQTQPDGTTFVYPADPSKPVYRLYPDR